MGQMDVNEILRSSVTKVRKELVMEGVKMILRGLGIDINDEHFRDTPRRVAEFYEELLSPKITDEDHVFFSEDVGIVIASGIRTYSLCPHHLLPVVYDVSLAYKPNGKIVGISKLVKVTYDVSSKIQVQERFTEMLADRLVELTESNNVMVVVRGLHFCMLMRGVKSNARIVTTAVRGVFNENSVRSETMRLMSRGNMRW